VLDAMNVLILLSYNAPFGGLQEHAHAQGRAIRRAGGQALFFATEGPFADRLEADGFQVLRDGGRAPSEEARRTEKAL